MQQHFNPPHYTWTAATVHDATNTLRAVIDLLDAHLTTLVPTNGAERHSAAKAMPVSMTVSLDLSGAVQQINTQRTLNGLETEFDDHA